jgi:hypothetical protein
MTPPCLNPEKPRPRLEGLSLPVAWFDRSPGQDEVMLYVRIVRAIEVNHCLTELRRRACKAGRQATAIGNATPERRRGHYFRAQP